MIVPFLDVVWGWIIGASVLCLVYLYLDISDRFIYAVSCHISRCRVVSSNAPCLHPNFSFLIFQAWPPDAIISWLDFIFPIVIRYDVMRSQIYYQESRQDAFEHLSPFYSINYFAIILGITRKSIWNAERAFHRERKFGENRCIVPGISCPSQVLIVYCFSNLWQHSKAPG